MNNRHLGQKGVQKEGVMNTTMIATDATLDQMFERMGNLLKDIAAAKTGLGDEMAAQSGQTKVSQPGLGEQLDLTA